MVDKMCEKGNKSLNKCIMHAFIIDLSFVKPLYKGWVCQNSNNAG